jgi:sugar phosphate isomerase/epimerase
MKFNRRVFAGMMAGTAVASAWPTRAWAASSPFKVGVISDEISQDFDHACHVIANEFGLQYVELRAMWGKNLQQLGDDDLGRAKGILAKYSLTVTDIASPLYKVNFPGAPRSQYGGKDDMHGADEKSFKEQDEVLERSIAQAKQFGTNKVRCFDFWRLDDPKPYRAAMNDVLRKAAETCGKQGIVLVLENEFECNTATGREAAATLAAVDVPHLALNWDPGNAVMRGELDAYPGGWDVLPKHRIHHCHVKNAQKDATGKIVWAPVDVGYIDWTAQFRALKGIGYHEATNLETHWKDGTSPESSTDRSWAGMKKDLLAAGVTL